MINKELARLTSNTAVAGSNHCIPRPNIGGAIGAQLDSCALAGNGTAGRVGPLRCQAACAGSLSSGAPTCGWMEATRHKSNG
jgi:hypothetical protein